MSLVRTLTLAAVTGLGTLVTGFVAADRLAHAPPSAPVRAMVLPEPDAADRAATVTQQGTAVEPAPSRLVNGFDTDRLNALMRGDPLPAPSRR